MKINAWQIIGLALVILGAAGGAVEMSIGDSPYFSLSVYTNIAAGSDNTLYITLVNYATPSGQLVHVTFDGVGVAQTVALDSLGKATINFESGAAGYHFITCYWSDGAQSAEATAGYFSVQGQTDPTLPDEPTVPIFPLSWIVMAAGAVMVGIGTFGVKRAE